MFVTNVKANGDRNTEHFLQHDCEGHRVSRIQRLTPMVEKEVHSGKQGRSYILHAFSYLISFFFLKKKGAIFSLCVLTEPEEGIIFPGIAVDKRMITSCHVSPSN